MLCREIKQDLNLKIQKLRPKAKRPQNNNKNNKIPTHPMTMLVKECFSGRFYWINATLHFCSPRICSQNEVILSNHVCVKHKTWLTLDKVQWHCQKKYCSFTLKILCCRDIAVSFRLTWLVDDNFYKILNVLWWHVVLTTAIKICETCAHKKKNLLILFHGALLQKQMRYATPKKYSLACH